MAPLMTIIKETMRQGCRHIADLETPTQPILLRPLIKIQDQSITNITLLQLICRKLAQEGTLWELETIPQAIWETKDHIRAIIMRQFISKIVPSNLLKNCFKRLLNPSFLLERHQSQDSPQYFILILTKVAALIIREVILLKGKVWAAPQATKRFSKEKIVDPRMRELRILSIRKLIIMVIKLKVRGRIRTHRIRVFH